MNTIDKQFVEAFESNDQQFIKDNIDKVNWNWISSKQKLIEEFIDKFSDRVNWDYISIFQKLTEEFIEKYYDKVNWGAISAHQKLTEEFIEKYSDRVYWYSISEYQQLTEEFIEKFADKVYWCAIKYYQKLTNEFIKKHNLEISENNWLYKSNEYKLEYLKKIAKYEIIDDKYIIAYKSCRSYGYSTFNFQYKYEVGQEYSSHCDCNIDDHSSFGLSAWTKEKAIEHCNQMLLKVKIDIEDIGAIVQEENKIRCFKLTVLEIVN